MKKNIMLCIDLKTHLLSDNLLQEGKVYHGALMLDDEFHARFVEKASKTGAKRNIRLFDGRYITMTYRLRDRHVRLNFKELHLHAGFKTMSYAVGVRNEIEQALRSL